MSLFIYLFVCLLFWLIDWLKSNWINNHFLHFPLFSLKCPYEDGSFFPCLLGDYFTEILSCYWAQTSASAFSIVLPLASHFCTHTTILFCMPEHSNHNPSHYSVKLYIFSSSSFLINQSFQLQNHFSCSLNCLRLLYFCLVMMCPGLNAAFKVSCHQSNGHQDDFHYLLLDTKLHVNTLQEEVCSRKCNGSENKSVADSPPCSLQLSWAGAEPHQGFCCRDSGARGMWCSTSHGFSSAQTLLAPGQLTCKHCYQRGTTLILDQALNSYQLVKSECLLIW